MQQDLLWGIPLVAFVAAVLAVCRKFIPNFGASIETAVGMVLMAAGVFFGQALPGLEAAYPIIMLYVKWGAWAITAALMWGNFWPMARAAKRKLFLYLSFSEYHFPV